MSNVILSDQPPQPGARQFPVSFSPPRQPLGRGSAPNNLQLAGPGSVTITADSVVFADEIAAHPAQNRTIALADVVNVGYGAAEEIIAVRTRNDDRQVLFWMRAHADAQALLALLPKETTPGFVESQAREAKFRAHIQALAPHAPVTPAIIVINVVVFLVMLAFGAGLFQADAGVHVRFGSNFGPLTWNGEPWRLLTAAFIHFGVIHLAFNMYALYSGGDLTERLYGSARFAVIYLLSALAGSVASSSWNAAHNSAGASGAIFGVYGALLVFFAVRRDDIPVALYKAAGKGALMLCAYSLVLGAANPFIDNAAHVGGLLGGALSGFLLVRPFDPAARTGAQPWRLVAVSAGLLAALALLAAPLWWPGAERAENLRLDRTLERFTDEYSRLTHRFEQVQVALKGGLPRSEAADQLDTDVLVPWRRTTRELTVLPPIKPASSAAALRLVAMQDYAVASEKAYALSIVALRNPSAEAYQQSQDARARAEELARTLLALNYGKR